MTLSLSPEAEARLQAAAAQSGRTPEEIVAALVETLPVPSPLPHPAASTRSVMDFAGIGAGRPGSLQGRDAQEYVNEMRAEWDEREQSWRQ